MEFNFEVKTVLTLEHKKGQSKSNHVKTDFNLYPSKNLDKKQYINLAGLPTKSGSLVITNVLVQGLIGNIHLAHESGFRDSAEHLRYIISELERGFVVVADVTKSNF